MITCQEVSDWLLDYLSGELSENDRRAVDHHLGSCPACVSFVHSYRMTISLSRRLAAQPTPPELIERIQVRFTQAGHLGRM
ncbi:MAG: zf-HC2 domain-containing protein [Gemmatales bacterium]|nr:zf-HC2 domain-containing protein [Gemmatales bacterium]MDW8385750.1 zf-HC2 domain-containing protein [Gemmatales bacterium]